MRGLFHILLLPEGWSLLRQLAFAQIQTVRNKLSTYLVPQRGVCLSFIEDGSAYPMYVLPTSLPVVHGGLKPCVEIEVTGELEARATALTEFCRSPEPETPLTRESALEGQVIEDMDPASLTPCESCGEWNRDRVLVEREDEYEEVPLRCACRNDTRCARCGRPLWERRLRTVYFDGESGTFQYAPGRYGLSHRCPDEACRARLSPFRAFGLARSMHLFLKRGCGPFLRWFLDSELLGEESYFEHHDNIRTNHSQAGADGWRPLHSRLAHPGGYHRRHGG